MLPARRYQMVLDAGCGPGNIRAPWHLDGATLVALDLSRPMLLQAQRLQAAHHYVLADIEALPLANQQFDLVWSNLSLQWCASLELAIKELHRVTRPGGLVAFSTLLHGSLPELDQAWRAVDSYAHVNAFSHIEEIRSALAGWKYQHHCHRISLQFPSALSAMLSLKGVGATHLHQGRPHTRLGRKQLHQLEMAWPKQQGQYSLTYQLFMGLISRE